MKKTKKVETSVVIRAVNEQKHLPALMESLEQQDYQDFEVLLVDSGSIDHTREIAAAHGARIIRIDSRDFTFGYSLNVGVREAKGSLIAIASAHTLPVDSQWLGRLVAPLRDEQTAMVYGRQLGNDLSKFSEIRDFERIFGPDRKILEPPNFFANNANAAIRKDLWEEYPFDPALPGLEDIDWAKFWMEKGYKVVYEPQAGLYHIHEETWRQIKRRYYREAVAARWIGIKSKRHVILDLYSEMIYLAEDIVSSLFSGSNKLYRIHESVLFRFYKAYGNARGLLEKFSLQNPERRDALFFDRSCKAVVIEGVNKATFTEVPIPEIKPGDVLIRTAYVAICGTDLEILDGTLGYFESGMAKYPIIPGHEFSGTVVAVGNNVSDIKEGDSVVVECIQSCGNCPQCNKGNFIGCADRAEVGVLRRDGAYSEYVVTPAMFVHVLPDSIDLRSAALCEPIAVALKGFRRLGPYLNGSTQKTGKQRCAVVGAGPLGHLCALLLDNMGHEVTVFDRDERRLQYFQGSSIHVNNDLVNGLSGQELLVEVTGDPEALQSMLVNSDPGTTFLLLGLPYAQRSFSFESIVAYDKTVVGSVGSAREDFIEAIRLLPSLKMDHLIDHCFEPENFRDAWEKFRSHEILKGLLKFSDDRELK